MNAAVVFSLDDTEAQHWRLPALRGNQEACRRSARSPKYALDSPYGVEPAEIEKGGSAKAKAEAKKRPVSDFTEELRRAFVPVFAVAAGLLFLYIMFFGGGWLLSFFNEVTSRAIVEASRYLRF